MLISRLDFHHIHELKAYSTERLRAIRAAAVAATDASDQEKEALALIGEQLERDDDPSQLVFTGDGQLHVTPGWQLFATHAMTIRNAPRSRYTLMSTLAQAALKVSVQGHASWKDIEKERRGELLRRFARQLRREARRQRVSIPEEAQAPHAQLRLIDAGVSGGMQRWEMRAGEGKGASSCQFIAIPGSQSDRGGIILARIEGQGPSLASKLTRAMRRLFSMKHNNAMSIIRGDDPVLARLAEQGESIDIDDPRGQVMIATTYNSRQHCIPLIMVRHNTIKLGYSELWSSGSEQGPGELLRVAREREGEHRAFMELDARQARDVWNWYGDAGVRQLKQDLEKRRETQEKAWSRLGKTLQRFLTETLQLWQEQQAADRLALIQRQQDNASALQAIIRYEAAYRRLGRERGRVIDSQVKRRQAADALLVDAEKRLHGRTLAVRLGTSKIFNWLKGNVQLNPDGSSMSMISSQDPSGLRYLRPGRLIEAAAQQHGPVTGVGQVELASVAGEALGEAMAMRRGMRQSSVQLEGIGTWHGNEAGPIERIYREQGFGSCMHNPAGHGGAQDVGIYDRSPAVAAITLRTSEGVLQARGLVWTCAGPEGRSLRFDKIYPKNSSAANAQLAKVCEELANKLGRPTRGQVSVLRMQRGRSVPYLDTMYNVTGGARRGQQVILQLSAHDGHGICSTSTSREHVMRGVELYGENGALANDRACSNTRLLRRADRLARRMQMKQYSEREIKAHTRADRCWSLRRDPSVTRNAPAPRPGGAGEGSITRGIRSRAATGRNHGS